MCVFRFVWALVLTAGLSVLPLQAAELSPEFLHPSGLRGMEIGSVVFWVVVFVMLLRQSLSKRELTFGLLLFISTTTMSWQDTYTAWAGYLLYNPGFVMMPWGDTLWTSPNKPWFVVATYGWFMTMVFLGMLWLVAKLRTCFPNLGLSAAVAVIGVPIFYVWDLVNEGFPVNAGYWTYAEYI